MTEPYDDPPLERLLRDTLRDNANHAPPRLTRPVLLEGNGDPTAGDHLVDRTRRPGTSRPRIRRQRLGRATPWIAAAAVAVIAISIPVLNGLRDEGVSAASPPPSHQSRGAAPGGTATSPTVPADWRVESYGGVEVRVPPTWGWGGAPTETGAGGGLLDCGATRAFVVPQGRAYEFVDETTPFVGRPAMMTDACLSGPPGADLPDVDAVWLGSPLSEGLRDLDAQGRRAETWAVGHLKVTVFTADPSLRQRILATARAVAIDGNGCPSRAPTGEAPAGDGRPGLSVCAYTDKTLLWSGRTTEAAAAAYDTAMNQAADLGQGPCPTTSMGQTVWLGRSGVGRWDRIDFACRRIVRSPATADGQVAPLTAATVEPWALGGVRAYVWGGIDLPEDVRPFFRGILG